MPPRKRPLEENESENDNGNASDNSSASERSYGSNISSRASSPKRRRVRTDSDTTPETNPSPANPHQFDINAPTINDRITQEEEDEETGEDGDDADEQATQALQQRRTRDRGRTRVGKEAGVLSQVDLWNFMCHKRFTFDLGPLINFICGKNGSGKSAILTAIILCLGGKASATNRGGSLKSFIKEGEEAARIVCRLRNRGEGAFQPEEYGDFIEVERHFSRVGASGYKLKNERGRIISTKKADLDNMLDFFALQIDNPLNVLSQDMARSFIASSNSAEKYRFFIKGIQLEQLDQDYNLIEEQLGVIRAKLIRKQGDVTSLLDRARAAEQRMNAAKQKDGIKVKIRDLRRQITWIQIEEQEQIHRGMLAEVEQAEEAITQGEAVVGEHDARFQLADTENQQANQVLEEATARLEVLKIETNQAREDLKEVKGHSVLAQTEQAKVKEEIKNANRAVKSAQDKIKAEEARLAEINGGGATQRLQDLNAARIKVDEAKTELDMHKAGQGDSERAIQDLSAEEKEKRRIVDSQRAELETMRNKVANMAKEWQNRPDGFKPNTDRLVQAIERETRWTRKPVGPIGKHVRLLEPKWSSIIERLLGSTLNGFFCFSKRDAELLDEHKRRVNCDAETISGNAQLFTPQEPDEQFTTVLRVLEIDDEYAKKQLMIGHAIEQHILIEDSREATSTMYDSGRLRNVRGCFALDPRDKRRGILLKYTNTGDPAQDPVFAWGGAARMKTDLEATIAAKRVELGEFEVLTSEAHKIWTEARAKEMRARSVHKRYQADASNLAAAYQAAQDEVERLEAAISEDTIESGALVALKEALRDAEESRAMHNEQFKDSVTSYDAKKAVVREKEAALRYAEEKQEEVGSAAMNAKTQSQKADRKRARELQDKNNAVARVEDARKDKTSMEQRAEEQRTRIEDYERQAKEICERVNIEENVTRQDLLQRYEGLKAEQRTYAQQVGATTEEATIAYRNAKRAFKTAQEDQESLESLANDLENSLQDRRRRWKKFRDHITARARLQFQVNLSERGFRGILQIDHKSRLLNLQVEPDESKASGRGRNAKTLSGGEKSFSQICLLLAMWEAMGSPIRCLDEFDVFMDAINRNMSVSLIIDAARDSADRQYILISPGSKADIQRADDVHVLEIQPPIRGQGVIPD